MNKFVKTVNISNVWYNDELRSQRLNRDLTYKKAYYSNENSDWDEHYKVNRQYSSNLKATRSSFHRNRLKSAENPKKMWKFLKELVNGVKDEGPQLIDFNSTLISGKQEITNGLNKYFIDSIVEISESIPTIDD